MTEHVQVGGLRVAKVLLDFVNNEAIKGTGLDAATFWAGADKLIHELAPKNKALLAKRDDLQAKIDAWHQAHAKQAHDAQAYKAFLQEIGYLLPEVADFQATTQNVDEEIARMAGPQLVVPVMNARFALNASNARWGSLYDALYGTDAISEAEAPKKAKATTRFAATRSSPLPAPSSTTPRHWLRAPTSTPPATKDRKSTRLNSS